ncbi:MAG: TonB-dependent receptor [Candidatus Latescibacteria bacterium]|nr:TonB-dependent receptor [Candidatus Latescibacterota bacterium]
MKPSSILTAVGLITGGMGSVATVAAQEPPRYILDPVVVTATRTETEASRIGSSVEVITGRQLREMGSATLLEALALVPGIAVARAGPAGGTGSLYLRGAKGEHLLVLVDGVTVNDPISPGGSFDWNTISIDAIESIEIVKGPQSTLYGSDAIAGVVHIITRLPSDSPGAHLELEGGNYRTLNANAGVSGELLGTAVRAEIARRRLGGVSTASEKYGNSEPDAWSMWSGALRLARAVGEGRIDITLRGSRSRFDLDDFGGPYGDDPNRVGWKADLTGAATFRYRPLQWWEQRLFLGISRTHRWGIDGPDPDHPDEHVDSDYVGLNQSIEWHHRVEAGIQQLAAGVTLKRQSGRSRYTSDSGGFAFSDIVPESSQSAWAVYLQDQFGFGPLAVTAGGRLDNYSDYGSQPTFRMAVALPISWIRLRASVGTGFRAPSLYQRFSPDYGNPDLDAEKSLGRDAGIEALLFGRGSVRLTRYRQDIEGIIDFVTDPTTWVSRYENRSRLRLEGWETGVKLALTGWLGLDGGLTAMEIGDDSAGAGLLRRPRRTATFGLSSRPASRWSWGLRMRYVGERSDKDWSAPPYPVVELEPVTILDGEISYDLGPDLTIRLRARNLTDQNPEWVWGYGSLGRAFYLGVLFRK